MTNKEFRDYAFDKMRQGYSESQIAKSLGMSLAHFMGRLNGMYVDKDKKEKTKEVKEEPTEEAVTAEE